MKSCRLVGGSQTLLYELSGSERMRPGRALGAIRISDSVDEMEQLDRRKLLTDMTKQATELAAALQDERDQSAGPLAHGAMATDFTVKGARGKTDRARDSFLQGTSDIDDARGDQAIDSIRHNVVQISTQLRVLKDIRRDAYKQGLPTSQTVSSYNQLIEQLLGLSRDMALATSNPEMIQRTRTLAAFSSAKEYASVQRAVISAALPPNKTEFGKLSDNDRLYALSALRNEEAELDSLQRSYEGTGGNAAELMKPLDDSNAVIKDANDYAARVLESPSGLKNREKRSYPDWNDAATTKLSSKGQVVIPEEIRSRLGLKPGTQFVVVGDRDVVILKMIHTPDMGEFEDIVGRARKAAKKAGLKKQDVRDAIRKTRQRG